MRELVREWKVLESSLFASFGLTSIVRIPMNLEQLKNELKIEVVCYTPKDSSLSLSLSYNHSLPWYRSSSTTSSLMRPETETATATALRSAITRSVKLGSDFDEDLQLKVSLHNIHTKSHHFPSLSSLAP